MPFADRGGAEERTSPLWPLRTFLLIGAVQGYAIGVTGLLTPGSIVGFPLETTPLNTRFVASFYLAGAIGLTLSALGRRGDEMRVLLIAFSVVTALLLGVTIVYWSDFTVDGVPYPWLVSYIFEPVVGGVLILWLGLSPWRPTRLGGARLLLALEAAALGGLGALMLAAPRAVIDVWPWKLSEILARLYGAIFIALGFGAIIAIWERRPRATMPFLATSLVLAVCCLAIYPLHRSRFDGSTATGVWLVVTGLATIAFAVALGAAVRPSGRVPTESAVALEG